MFLSAAAAIAIGAAGYAASSTSVDPELSELQKLNIEAIAASGGTVDVPFYCVGNKYEDCRIEGRLYIGISRKWPNPDPKPYPGGEPAPGTN